MKLHLTKLVKDLTILNSTKLDTLGLFSRKINDVNDVNIVNFTWYFVLLDTVKVSSVKCEVSLSSVDQHRETTSRAIVPV